MRRLTFVLAWFLFTFQGISHAYNGHFTLAAESLPPHLNPAEINFSQRNVASNVVQYTDDMAAGRWDWARSGPLRVMERDGSWVSNDNRRLMAARQSGSDSVPVQVVLPSEAFRPGVTWEQAFTERLNYWRNTPPVPNGGLSTLPTVRPPRR